MKKFLFVALITLPFIALTSCTSDDDNASVQITKTYQLSSVSDPNISGTARFIKNSDNSTTVELQLSGTTAGGMHPAHIHINTAVEGGVIAVDLGTVDGDTGFSTITFNQLNDATAVTYDDMIAFDGYINVHLSSADLSTLVAQGDIGQNELTASTTAYTLDEVNSSGISGTAVLTARVNGETLVQLDINGTQTGTNHVAHIHDGSVANPGAIAITLTTVDGETGKSLTSVSKKDDDTAIGYANIQAYDGYINIHASEVDLTIVAQGNIGSNAMN